MRQHIRTEYPTDDTARLYKLEIQELFYHNAHKLVVGFEETKCYLEAANFSVLIGHNGHNQVSESIERHADMADTLAPNAENCLNDYLQLCLRVYWVQFST